MPLRNIFFAHSSGPQSYGKVARNLFWESSMQKEYNSILENQTWDLVHLLVGRKLVRCRWVYRIKRAVDG
jgi:hypothetical protein